MNFFFSPKIWNKLESYFPQYSYAPQNDQAVCLCTFAYAMEVEGICNSGFQGLHSKSKHATYILTHRETIKKVVLRWGGNIVKILT